MTDSILDRYAARVAETSKRAPEELEGYDDFGAFSILRGVRERSIMLEIRHRDGNISAFGYAWLDHAIFNPSEGITLFFGRRKLLIQGRNLDQEIRPNVQLFSATLRHRVPWIQESSGAARLDARSGGLLIDNITVES